MKGLLQTLTMVALVAGVTAQAQGAQQCDPIAASTELIDLLEPIGSLSCKAPSVNFTAVLSELTGSLNGLSVADLKQVPGLLELTLNVDPAALRLNRLVPLLSQVPAGTLAQVFPVLAVQPRGTIQKLVRFLQVVPRAQLERLSPLFGRITEGQIRVLAKALDVLPSHAWDLLINLVQKLGTVTDSVVAVGQVKGVLPGDSSSSIGAVTSASTTTSSSSSGSKPGSTDVGVSANATGASTSVGVAAGARTGVRTFVIGRKLLQATEPGSAADNISTACVASTQGLVVAEPLLGDFGTIVCKYGADNLKPVLSDILTLLNKQSPQTLARIPALAQQLGDLTPQQFSAFFKIPQATLRALIPILADLDSAAVSEQLQVLANVDAETVGKLVFFLQQTRVSTVKLLIPLFAQLTDEQLGITIKLLNALSPGQIILAIQLLDKFGFAVDAIGRAIPDSSARGNSFNIGPIRVTVGSGAAAGGFMHPILGRLG